MSNPRSMTQAEADLLARITSEIVEPQVIKPMDQIGWEHGTPPAVPIPTDGTTPPDTTSTGPNHEPETTPATTAVEPKPAETVPVTPTPTPEGIDWESLREPNGLYLGKYKTPAEALRGMGHVVAMAKNAFSERDLIKKEVEELRGRQTIQPTTIAAKPDPVVEKEPAAPSQLELVLNRIIEDGGTIDEATGKLLKEALAADTAAAAQSVIAARDNAQSAERQRWEEVDNYMRQNHPDSFNFISEIQVFRQANPLIERAVQSMLRQGDYVGASELAWVEFQKAQNLAIFNAQRATDVKKEITLEEAEKVRKAAQAEAVKDAGVMTTNAGGVHETPTAGVTQDEIDAAAAEMARTGLGENWRRLVIGRDLPDELFQ